MLAEAKRTHLRRRLLLALLIAGAASFLGATAQRQTGAPAGIPVPLPPAVASPGQESAIPVSRSFRVRVLNGRNGLPVSGVHVKLWYDEPSGEGYTVVTGPNGVALMPAPIGKPIRLLADILSQTDCRRIQQYAPKPAYVFETIASSGLQSENTCGDVQVRPSPGELVLYVRSSRWYEKLNRNGDPNLP